jgi:hypothetical protein
MPRSRLLTALLLAGVALATAAVVMLVAWDRGGGGESTAGLPTEPESELEEPLPPAEGPPVEFEDIGARGVLSPRTILFGDTLRAGVEVVVDNTRIDPASVRVAMNFAPWEVLGEPERIRRDAGTTTYISTRWTLRCLTGPCVPAGQAAPLEFDPARVSYVEGDRTDGGRSSTPVAWPLLTVFSRFASAAFEGATAASSSTPWRADTVTLPAVSYRVSPSVLAIVAIGIAGLFAAGGIALVVLAWPRREHAPPPEPEPEPLPVLTPLEQALELLEDASRDDGAEDRRRSLELVAEVLADHDGARDIVRAAKVLAWSEDAPEVEDTSGLAQRVRTKLEEEAALLRNGDGDGDDGADGDRDAG